MIGGNGEVGKRGKGEEPRDRKDRENLFFHSYVSPFFLSSLSLFAFSP